MEKKHPKKSKTTPEYDSKRQQNVLLEKIYSEVKTVAEGHDGLNRRIDKIDIRLGGMEDSLSMINTKVDRVERELEGVKLAVKDVDIRLGEKAIDHGRRDV